MTATMAAPSVAHMTRATSRAAAAAGPKRGGRVATSSTNFGASGDRAPSVGTYSNLQPDFNVRVIERIAPDSSALRRELDESNRFVQKSAESTSI
jgi:hypothetical protein